MNQSTLFMINNFTADVEFAVKFGVVSIDWSYQKSAWALQRPMEDERMMFEGLMSMKKLKPAMRVFVYRNFVKSLNWFESNRVALATHPEWFFKFEQPPYHVPTCTQNKCTNLYHDQEQTPQVPNATDPNPDGRCVKSCDCGTLPCGEYVWRVARPDVQQYLLDEVLFDRRYGLGNRNVDGVFIDDFWCSPTTNTTRQCQSDGNGPSEIDKWFMHDANVSLAELDASTRGWLSLTTRAQQRIIDSGKYTWSLMMYQYNANAMPIVLESSGLKFLLLKMLCEDHDVNS